MAGPVDPATLVNIYDQNVNLYNFTDRQEHLTSVNRTILDVDDRTQFLRHFKYLTLNAQKAPAGKRAYDIFQVIQFIFDTTTHPGFSALILFNLNIHDDCEPDYSGFRWIYILFDNTKVAANTSLLELLYEKTVPGFESYYFLPKKGFGDQDHPGNIEEGLSNDQTGYKYHPYFFTTEQEIYAVAKKIKDHDPNYLPFQYAYDGTYTRGSLVSLYSEPNKAINLKTQWIGSDPGYPTMITKGTVPFLVALLTANLNYYGFQENFLKQRQAVAYLCFGVQDATFDYGYYSHIKDTLAVACLQEMNADFLAHKVNIRSSNLTREYFRQWAASFPWLGLVLDMKTHNSELALEPEVQWLESNILQTRDNYTQYITVHQPKQNKIRIPKASWPSYIGRGGADGIPFIIETKSGYKIICRKLNNDNYIMGCYEYYHRSTRSTSNLLKCYGMVINPNLSYNNGTYQLNFEKSSVCICRLQSFKTVLLFNPVYECLSPLGLSTMDNLIVGNVHFACRGQGDGASSSAKDELMYFVFVVCPAIFNEKGSNFNMRSSYARVLRVLGDFNLPANWEENELLSIIHILNDESALNTFFDSNNIPPKQRKACNDFYHTPLRTMTSLGKEGNAWRLAVSLVHTDTPTYNGRAPAGAAGTTGGAAGLVRNYDCEFVCFWELNKQYNDTRIAFYKQQLAKVDLPDSERRAFAQALLEMEGFEKTFMASDTIVCREKYSEDHDAILTVSAVPSSDDARSTTYLRSRPNRGILPAYRGNPRNLDKALLKSQNPNEYNKLAKIAQTSSAVGSALSRAADSVQETGRKVASFLGQKKSHEPSSSIGARRKSRIISTFLASHAATKLREGAIHSKLPTVTEDSEDSQMSSGGSINKIQLIK